MKRIRLLSTGPLIGLTALSLLLMASLSPAARGSTQRIERILDFEGLQISSEETGRWVELHLPGTQIAVSPGEPAVPSLRLELRLIPGYSVGSVRLEILEEQRRGLRAPVVPYAGEQSLVDELPPRAAADAAIYAQDGFFPSEPVRLVSVVELSTGTRYAIVRVNPVRFRPASGELHWIRRARLILDLEVGEEGPVGALGRQRPALAAKMGALRKGDWRGALLLSEQGFLPRERPSIEGSPVEYAIISPPDPDMVTAWQELADWKTSCGHPAQVVTTAWIDENYPAGADLAERMRLFLRDAYLHWGLKWAVLGADVSLVPNRYARSWQHNGDMATGTDVACDYYYACLDGTWDADQDGVFGESTKWDNQGDDVDFTPEIHVGRISARDADQVRDFLDKYFIYVKSPPDGYLDHGLMLGEVLFHKDWNLHGYQGGADCHSSPCSVDTCRVYKGSPVCMISDGAKNCFEIEEVLYDVLAGGGPDLPIQLDFLLERAEYWAVHEPRHTAVLENKTNVIDYLSQGSGFVFHVGHAYRDRWAIGDGNLLLGDLPSITNGDHGGRFFWSYTIDCYSAAIDYHCIGEQMVIMPGHGAIGYMGSSNVDWPQSGQRFALDFFRFLYQEEGTTLGDGFFASLAAHAPTGPEEINRESTIRFLLFSLLLIGDPGMMVWRATPSEMHVDFEETPPLGAGALQVTVTEGSDGGGQALEGARVCVHKQGDVYAVALTGAGGAVQLPFWPQSVGDFSVTVTASGHRPQENLPGNVIIPETGPALVVDSLVVIDDGQAGSIGNGNGRVELGETIRLPLTISNEGQSAAENLEVRLRLAVGDTSGLVEILDSTSVIGTLSAGAAETDDEAFLLEVAARPPDSLLENMTQITAALEMTVQTETTVFSRELLLDATWPRLSVAINGWGEDVGAAPLMRELCVGLINEGKGTAGQSTARLEIVQGVELVSPDELDVPELEPGDTTRVGPFRIYFYAEYESLARLALTVADETIEPPDTLHTRILDLRAPQAPDSVGVVGLPDAMVLSWNPAEDLEVGEIAGYKVYRAAEGDTSFVELQEGLLKDHRYMTDGQLEHLMLFRYFVRAVDSAGNLGDASDTVSAYTSPGMLMGWPNDLMTPYASSPLICELDRLTSPWDSTNVREIFFSGERIYAFHGDGSEVLDGDGVASTAGPFSDEGAKFHGKAAAADIDADGEVEVVAICRENRTVYCWDYAGRTPRWTFPFSANIAWRSPTLADLDDDGRMEVIFISGWNPHQGICVLKHDGQPYIPGVDGKGMIADLNGSWTYHSPSVGDVDGDGSLEIVATTRDGVLYVVEGTTGNDLPGFVGGISFADLGPAQKCRAAPTLADVDGIAGDEIFVVAEKSLMVFDKVGNCRWNANFDIPFPLTVSYDVHPEPVLGDIDGDNNLDVAVVERGGKLWAWQANGLTPLAHFPVDLGTGETLRYGSCILANVDDDPNPEIIFGDAANHIYAYTHEGELARGFPIQFIGNMAMKSLAAWDVDGDGYQNLVVQAEGVQNLGVFHLEGVAFNWEENPWPMRHRDNRNTGRYTDDSPVGVQLVLEEARVDPEGRVHLAWVSAAPVMAFRIWRTGPDLAEAIQVGEIPGKTGYGPRRYEFEDTPGRPGTYAYRINPVGDDGREEDGIQVTVWVPSSAGTKLCFHRVGPSPVISADRAHIVFMLPGSGGTLVPVKLHVIDVQGRVVQTIVDEPLPAGSHHLEWDGRDRSGRLLPSGLYLLRLSALGRSARHRVMLVR